MSSDAGWERFETGRFVDPTLVARLKSTKRTGTITDDGFVDFNEDEGVSDLRPSERYLEPGLEVEVKISRGRLVGRSLEQAEASKSAAAKRREERRAKLKRQRNEARDEAIEFWSRYRVPFRCDAGTKGRRAELLAGSSGTGMTGRSVVHLYALEGFDLDGYSRDRPGFLCKGNAKNPHPGTRFKDGDGDEFVPAVTCQTCLRRMKRWRLDDDDDSEGE